MSINVYQKNGRRLYEVQVKVRDKSGKQVGRKRLGISSEIKARKVEYELRKELEHQLSLVSHWTFKNWHEECIRRMKLSMKRSTVIGYDGGLKKWLPDEWNEKKIVDISKADVYELIFEDLTEGANAYTRRRVYKCVARIFEMAVEEGILGRNPTKGIRVKVPVAEKKVLNVNEADLLLKKAKEHNHRFYPIWAFALFTGMRSGEMYAVQWRDIDFETELISVNKQWTSKDGLHSTKSNKNRIVPISPELKSLLTELKLKGTYKETVEVRVHGKPRKQVMDDLVLPRLNEWKYGQQALVLEDFCRGIGITEVKFHDLRATFITNLLAQGVPLVQVMSIVGHSKMSTTDEYLRLSGVNVKGATRKLGYRLPRESSEKVYELFPKG